MKPIPSPSGSDFPAPSRRPLCGLSFAGVAFIFPLALVALPGALLVSCKPVPAERTTAETTTDQAIAGRVQAALAASPSFKFPDVQVMAFRGTVQLSGFVLSADQKKAAEDTAKSVPGVKGVENKISLRP